MTSLTTWRAACDISARSQSFGQLTNYERPMLEGEGGFQMMMIDDEGEGGCLAQ